MFCADTVNSEKYIRQILQVYSVITAADRIGNVVNHAVSICCHGVSIAHCSLLTPPPVTLLPSCRVTDFYD